MTAQSREVLIFNGEEYGMASEPFNQYLAKNKIDWRTFPSGTALWRGYIGKWEIIDDKLYLTE